MGFKMGRLLRKLEGLAALLYKLPDKDKRQHKRTQTDRQTDEDYIQQYGICNWWNCSTRQ